MRGSFALYGATVIIGALALAVGCDKTSGQTKPSGSETVAAAPGHGEITSEPDQTPGVGRQGEAPGPAENEANEPAAEPGDNAAETVEPMLSVKMNRRIRYALKKKLGTPVALSWILHEKAADGSSVVFAIYELSKLEDCVRKGGGGRELRIECRETHGIDRLQFGLVRADFATPGPDTPEGHGGAMKVEHRFELEQDGDDVQVAMKLQDIDVDDKLELVVRIDYSWTEEASRGDSEFTPNIADYHVLDAEDLREQFAIRLEQETDEYTEMSGMASMSQVAYKDLNGDGHPDIVAHSAEWETLGTCEFDENDWPIREEGDDLCHAIPERTDWLYDRQSDAWIAKMGAGKPAAEQPAKPDTAPASAAKPPDAPAKDSKSVAPTPAKPANPTPKRSPASPAVNPN